MAYEPSNLLCDHALAQVAASSTRLFVMLNAGRDPELIADARARCLRCASLLPEDLAIAMASHGPFLLKVDPASDFARSLVRSQWGQSILTLLWSPYDFDDVLAHMQRFVRIATSDGQRLVFRCYDPLILASYLSAFSPAQRRLLFSRVVRIVTAITPDMILEFDANKSFEIELTIARLEGSGVRSERTPLALPPLSFDGAQAEPEVVFNRAQMEAPLLANPVMLAARLEDYLKPDHGPRMACYPRGFLQAMLVHGALLAIHGYGIQELRNVYLFVDLQWRIAPGFYLEPRLAAVLSRRELSADERFDRLATSEYGDAWLAAESLDLPEYWFMEASHG